MVEDHGDFRFRYCKDVQSPGKVRVYIERQPSYGGRPTDSHSTHRLASGGGAPPHICFKDAAKPSSLSEARSRAHEFATATKKYIRTGRFG